MSRRKSIVVPEIAHRFPVPNACRVGNLVISGSIQGIDPVTHTMPSELTEQCSNMFSNMKSIIETAGGTTDDIPPTVTVRRARFVNPEFGLLFPHYPFNSGR